MVKPALDGICDCGRYDLALEGGILGRADDMLIVRGVNVYPSALEQIIRNCPGVSEYRVRVRTENALSEIDVDVEVAADRAVFIVQQLESAFESALRLRVAVHTVPPGTLPRSETKSRPFVSA